jgi:hypothetical protein
MRRLSNPADIAGRIVPEQYRFLEDGIYQIEGTVPVIEKWAEMGKITRATFK